MSVEIGNNLANVLQFLAACLTLCFYIYYVWGRK
jgi:hypothetical protein